jgi:uncharacterized sulfatase
MNRLLVLFFCALPILESRATAADRKPNVLLIYSDDHGWADLGAQGVDRDVRTPHLDQLVRDGVLFERGYVTAPQCTPSRAGVITGRYQQRLGVEHNGIPLPPDAVTLPERLKPAGYVSGISGKWHLDVTDERGKGRHKVRFLPESLPHRQGFEEYFTGFMQDYFASHALDGSPFADAPHKLRDERCRVVIQTEAALAFLERRAKRPEQPWFLYLAYMVPHVLLESPEPWFSKTPPHLPLQRRQALALIGAIDDGVGRIRNKLSAMGQDRTTLIVFIGDNGAPLGKAWDGSLNRPMVGQKGMLSEGGIRVPFVAAWPGRIPGGQVYEHPVISLDVAATAVAMAGLPHDDQLDGVNLIPYLTGENKAAPHAALFWRWQSQAAVLEMPYKLIVLGDRERLLFDITQPDGESISRNLITKHPAVAARLLAKLQTWCQTLQPPGMPKALDRHHEGLFAGHGIIAASQTAAEASAKIAAAGSIHGWLCRNGVIAIKDGALSINPTASAGVNGRPFITHSSLDLPGPVTATLWVRAKQGGPSVFTWRTHQQPEFAAENAVRFDWPTSADWREVKVMLPVKGRLIHLRITPPKDGAGVEVRAIELAGAGTKAVWQFCRGRATHWRPALRNSQCLRLVAVWPR